MNWAYLGIAIVAEVIATSALKASDGFARPGPSALVVAGYGAAFYGLSVALRTIPVGVAYAVWSGIGIVLIAGVAWERFGQRLDAPALILCGVLVLHLASGTVSR